MQYYNYTKCSCHELHNTTSRSLHKLLCNSEPLVTATTSYLLYITNQLNVFFTVMHLQLISNSIPICDSAFEHYYIHEISPCIYTITKQLTCISRTTVLLLDNIRTSSTFKRTYLLTKDAIIMKL